MEKVRLFQESAKGRYVNVVFDNGNIVERSTRLLDAKENPLFGFPKSMKVRSGLIFEEEKQKKQEEEEKQEKDEKQKKQEKENKLRELCLQNLYQDLLQASEKAKLNKILIRVKKDGSRHDRPHEWEISIHYVFIL